MELQYNVCEGRSSAHNVGRGSKNTEEVKTVGLNHLPAVKVGAGGFVWCIEGGKLIWRYHLGKCPRPPNPCIEPTAPLALCSIDGSFQL